MQIIGGVNIVQNAREFTKSYFSTGELASICRFTKHTIIAAIGKGELRASRTPGGHNRIMREDAINFMRRHNLTVNDPLKKILVVDDEKLILELLTQIFQGDEWQIFHASTAYQAGKLAEREKPDLILVDRMLPDLDLRDVVRHVREGEYGKECRILAVTSTRDEQDWTTLRMAGVDSFLAKPFQVDQLRERIESLLQVTA